MKGMSLGKNIALMAIIGLLVGCAQSSSQSSSPAAAQTRLQLGLEYLARNHLDAARENLQKAEQLAPDDYRIQLGMALYEQRIGENQAAEKRYRRLLRQAPANGGVMNNYGAFLCGLGQYVTAQQQFAAAVQLPDYHQVADALENAGYCFLKAGRPDDAGQWFRRALRYDPAKGNRLLAEADSRFAAGRHDQVRLLLNVYQSQLPATAESLWLQIRFAALAGHHDEVQRYGGVLARSFPQSKQYQQFLANEY
ncbi:type IV pilus biogenesis/stability protein PilW [Dickeya chrysanthemi Ech1591]|uniref:Type IV pilus biogenesis/stability protein PilW n=1 Tax=Dickeya chrysanthemi (strain Ech1591) TaxID=561229 RepID=C6CPD3_DICC1|nr:type IV pilus biogenesis/stability protein PilW [Dickeya chrysanthemi]ACT05988.1 type IV pilus biogenesis/stability protein PilW [Dickeya chrysanthemi Ech1591]TYL43475.1 type IV pilus biogenesis/stability protein PilW [Dickeya sp. ws52]